MEAGFEEAPGRAEFHTGLDTGNYCVGSDEGSRR